MKPKIQLEEIKIPELSEDDLLETIEQSRKIIQQLPLMKQEVSLWRSLKQIILFHGWRSLVTQGLLVFFLIMIAWIGFPVLGKNMSIAFVMVASITLSVSIAYELYRVELYQMKELEYSCTFSPQRLFVWKILLLSIVSLFGIITLCLVASHAYKLNFMTLIYGGCIPFIILNGASLQLAQHQYTLIVFLLLCIIFSIFTQLQELYMHALENQGLLYLILALIYYVTMNVWTYRKKAVL